MIIRGIGYVGIVGMALLMSACGGGTGGGGGTTPSPPVTLTWGIPQAIDSGTNNALHPQIAVDAAGNAQAVWMENDSTDTKRYYAWHNQYTAGGTWGTPQLLESKTSLTSGLTYASPSPPSVAMNGAGYAKAAWEQWVSITTPPTSPTYLYGIWSSDYDTNNWSLPVAVESGLGINGADVNSTQPQTAINANGDTLTIWNRGQNIGYYGIWASASIDGGTPKPLSFGIASDPRVNLDAAGNAVAIWRALPTNATNSNKTVWSSQYDVRNNSWNTPAVLPSLSSFNVVSAQLAGNADGVVFAVIEQKDSIGRSNVYAERFITSPSAYIGIIGTWVYDKPLQVTLDSATAPQVAVDANGNAMAVWVQIDHLSLVQKIWASYYNASTAIWQTPVLIDNPTTGFMSSSPQVAFGPSGRAIVVWSEYDDVNSSNQRIWSNEYTPGSGWISPSEVETGTGYLSTEPQVKIDGNGNAICVWTRTENGKARIWANRLSK